MRITIKGLTASTITFNSIGIILRGDSSKPEQYKESIARSVPINSMEAVQEIQEIKQAKLIDIELVDAEDSPYVYHLFPNLIPVKEEETPEATVRVKRGRGRPKGSTNKSKTVTGEAKVNMVKRSTKTTESVTAEVSEPVADVVTPDEDTAVVITEEGVCKTQVIKEEDKVADLDESDRTSASIEALQKMEEEERLANEAENIEVDESNLDESEQKGGKAVIGTGGTEMKKVEMKNSIIPEAEEIKKKDPFIKDDTPVDDKADVFINEDNDDGEDKFIEC